MQTDDQVNIWVPGIPQPGGSKKGFVYFDKNQGKHRAIITEANRKSKPWRQSVEWSVQELIQTPMEGALELRIVFFMPRPKNHYGTGRNAQTLKPSAPHFHTSKPDTTKLIRSTEDALKGIAWIDDTQVADQSAQKIYGDRPGALIQIRTAIPRPEQSLNYEEIIRKLGMRFL